MLRKRCVHPRRFSNPKLIPVSSKWSAPITASIPAQSLFWMQSEPVEKSSRLLLVNAAVDFAQPVSLRDMKAGYGKRPADRIIRTCAAGPDGVEPMALADRYLARRDVDSRWSRSHARQDVRRNLNASR